MPTMKQIAVVTGSNKGIGYEIVRKLANSGFRTILCARNKELGITSANSLTSIGLDVEFRELDIDSPESIANFANGIRTDYGRIDVLVNNAAIAFKSSDPTPFDEQAEPTVNVNFFGTLNVTTELIPLLQHSDCPRIVNVASQAGLLRILPTVEKKTFFTSPALTVDELKKAMTSFIHDVKTKQHSKNGWPSSCYGTSKLALIALTRVLARDYPDIIINCCCPGFCATDMSSHKGPKTAEFGARTPAVLAQFKRGDPSGKFYYEEQESQW